MKAVVLSDSTRKNVPGHL